MFTTRRLAAAAAFARLCSGLAAWLLVVVLISPAFGQQPAPRQAPTEQQKIDYLIATVAGLHDAEFIRNGTAYDASQAAAHMRLKLRFAGSRVKTAEDFITCCATGSSVSGINYTIRFAHGPDVDAATWLRGKLAAYEAGNALPRH
ncbi:hypothetical protein ACVWWQ_000313 [Rhodanobacter sp. TND4EL1]